MNNVLVIKCNNVDVVCNCSPYIIGTMNQATCSTTNLQLHHNFRWVLCANHMEPVQGFLGRYLRRRMAEVIRTGARCAKLERVVEWMTQVWQHLNRLLETHCSTDVTIGQFTLDLLMYRCHGVSLEILLSLSLP
jgi:hypothetical protein